MIRRPDLSVSARALCLALGLAFVAPLSAAQEEAAAVQAVAANPLLADWSTPFAAPPFAAFRPADFEPAFTAAMATHLAEIEAIAANPDAPTFANTIEAMERAGGDLDRVQRVFNALTASATNDDLRAIQREMSPRFAAHTNAINLNDALFARVADLYARRESLGLSPEQSRVLERAHTGFVRAGATLTGDERKRFAEIQERLATLYTTFSQNVQKDAEDFQVVLETDADKAGLPGYVLSAAAQAANDRGLPGKHVITLARSSFEPFMAHSTNRALREKVWRGWTNRGDNDNAYDNEALIKEILLLRLERARMLGYETFTHFRTSDTMAGDPIRVKALLDEVWAAAVAKARTEEAEIKAVMEEAGVNHDLKPWDWWHYGKKARASLYAVDETAVKEHLVLDNVLKAQFEVANRLFGVTFTERKDIPTYHPDVRVWEMKDADGQPRALFYGDYFARPGKRSGAWMSALRSQSNMGERVLPLIMNNCNYNKPAPGEPALISMEEAETIFHEFGHGLHGLLSDVTYPRLSGTSVDFDFVEFPAQIYEHWIREPAVLAEFARHYETGNAMPESLLAQAKAAANATAGFDNVEFIASAFVDQAFHSLTDEDAIRALDVNAFENGVLAQAGIPSAIEMRHRSPHFLHAFAGEFYGAGYYTYMWAGVLDNDGYAAFEEAGDPFDPELAKKLYDNVYSAGNTQPAMDAYIAFRGREPTTEALIRNRGLGADPGGS